MKIKSVKINLSAERNIGILRYRVKNVKHKNQISYKPTQHKWYILHEYATYQLAYIIYVQTDSKRLITKY